MKKKTIFVIQSYQDEYHGGTKALEAYDTRERAESVLERKKASAPACAQCGAKPGYGIVELNYYYGIARPKA
jgi:hypothetical protein